MPVGEQMEKLGESFRDKTYIVTEAISMMVCDLKELDPEQALLAVRTLEQIVNNERNLQEREMYTKSMITNKIDGTGPAQQETLPF